jgi:energy-coupling factor transporter transmembrane protein EcfT
LRFFPIILEEADSIIKAQKLRKEKLSIKEKLEAFCTAFMARVLRKAKDIEIAVSDRNVQEKNLGKINEFKKPGIIEITTILICISYITAIITIK